jgi:Flp pilus assembly protein TadB
VGQKSTRPLTKEQQRAERAKARERFDHAMKTGDERYLPARDKGPVRRWTRDYIDSRRSIGEYIMFLALGTLLLMFVATAVGANLLSAVIMLLMYLVIIGVVVDAIIRGRILKKALIAKFGEDRLPRGSVWYGINRSFQLRRTRMPNPQVERGEHPS